MNTNVAATWSWMKVAVVSTWVIALSGIASAQPAQQTNEPAPGGSQSYAQPYGGDGSQAYVQPYGVTASPPYGAPTPVAPGAPAPQPDGHGRRFGGFLGGIAVPGPNVTAFSVGALVSLRQPLRGVEPRLMAVAYQVNDDYTQTTGAVFVAHNTHWFGGAYGFGYGGGLGYADFVAKKSAGWDDDSLQIVAYVSPVILRLGERHNVELGLNVGPTRFVSHDVRPFGYFYVAGLL